MSRVLPRRRRLRAVVAAVGLTALTAVVVHAGILPTPPANPFIPPVGVQPGVAATPCSFPALGANEVRTLFTLPDDAGGSVLKTASTFAIFPASPCHVFRSTKSEIDRSDQSGAGFQKVFNDNTASFTFNRGPITISPVLPADANGQLFFFDQSGKNGVFHSPDFGAAWDERDGGLYTGGGLGAPAGPSGGILDFAVAPSDPSQLYLIGSSGGQTLVYASSDGGNNWTPSVVPTPGLSTIAVDPAEARHVLVAGPGTGGAPADVFYDSIDAGGHWSSHPGPPNKVAPVTLWASNPGGLRVYAQTVAPNGVHEYWRTESLGATWSRIEAPTSTNGGSLTFDPSDPNQMVLAIEASSGVQLAASFDGFASTRYVKTETMPGTVTAV